MGSSPEFAALFTPELNTLVGLFTKYNYELRIAGGAVRDVLMGKNPHDLDFATTATPEQMKDMFTNEEIRMLNLRGEKHGTITARLNDSVNFEVTTLRIDVRTDGRHAEVQWTKDWKLDALRRDLTVNSLFLGFDGTVYDYFQGVADIETRTVKFVGNAEDRIEEDYLRILRYFRFYGRIAEKPCEHDKDTLDAIHKHRGGLAKISGERIWLELKKIASGRFNEQLMITMIDLNITPYLGFPEEGLNISEFKSLFKRCRELNIELNPISYIAALLNSTDDMLGLHKRLKLSAFERDLGLFIAMYREPIPHEVPVRPYQYLLCDYKSDTTSCRKWICELLRYQGRLDVLKEFEQWELPRFPVSGTILRDEHAVKGKDIGRLLTAIRNKWKHSNFTLSREELLGAIPDLIHELQVKQT